MRAFAWALLCVSFGSGCSKPPPEPSGGTEPKTEDVPQAAAALVSSPAKADAARPTAAGPDCDKVCEPVRKLACRRASECVDSCRQMASAEVCRSELMRFYGCLASEPSEHWECMDDGTGAIKEGFCEREQSGFAACLEKSDVR